MKKEIESNDNLKESMAALQIAEQAIDVEDLYVPSEKIWDWIKQSNPFAPEPLEVKKPLIARIKGSLAHILDWILPVLPTPEYAVKGALAMSELTYEVGSFQINIGIYGTDLINQKRICGEIVNLTDGQPVLSSNVNLEHPDWDSIAVKTDEWGNFMFEPLIVRPTDRYEMSIELEQHVLIIENLPLGYYSKR